MVLTHIRHKYHFFNIKVNLGEICLFSIDKNVKKIDIIIKKLNSLQFKSKGELLMWC